MGKPETSDPDLNLYFLVLCTAFTCFVAVSIPFFGALLGFFGGFAFAPTTYFVSYLHSYDLKVSEQIVSLSLFSSK